MPPAPTSSRIVRTDSCAGGQGHGVSLDLFGPDGSRGFYRQSPALEASHLGAKEVWGAIAAYFSAGTFRAFVACSKAYAYLMSVASVYAVLKKLTPTGRPATSPAAP